MRRRRIRRRRNEKKNKKLLLDNRLWDVESDISKYIELDVDTIRKDPEIARRLFFPEVK